MQKFTSVRPKTLLLDVDGVIITGDHFSDALARDHQIAPALTATFFKSAFQKCLVGHADLKEELAPHLPSWGWNQSIEELLEYWFTVHSVTDAQVIDTVAHLNESGVRCYLATNQEHYRTQYLWDELGLQHFFRDIFASSNIGRLKKDHLFFHEVALRLQKHPTELVFFDDSPECVASARQTGVRAYVYSDFSQFQKDLHKEKLLF